jgi:hypothetical protein
LDQRRMPIFHGFTVKPHNLDSRILLDAVTLNKLASTDKFW